MKKLISAVLALTLLGTAAASAQPYRGGDHGRYDRGYHDNYRNDYRGGYRGDVRAREGAGLIGLGIGLFALAAIASAHDRPDYRYQSDYYGR